MARRPAALLAIVMCYGTIALVGVLSLMGVTMALYEGMCAGVVSMLAVLAAVGVLLGYARHRNRAPAVIAWVMFAHYNRIVEIAGFTTLVIATVWDWRLRKRQQCKQENADG